MKRNLLVLAGLLLAVSCRDGMEDAFAECDAAQPEVTIHQPRDPRLPTVPNRRSELTTQSSVAATQLTPLSDYLGRTYLDRTSLMGDAENFSIPAIDLPRLRADYPGYFGSDMLSKNFSDSYAYASDERFETQSHYTEKFSSGFKVNLGLFSLGRKKTMERMFSSSLSEHSSDACGELTVEIKNIMYTLRTASLVNRRIGGEYLTRDFVELLYNLTIDELLEQFGTFVVTGYYTGGRASALFYGRSYSVETATAREEGLKKDIDASYSWENGSVTGSLNFGRTNGSSSQTGNRFASVRMSLRTIGGTKDTGVTLGAMNIDDVRLDLSKWLASMDNEKNHTVIGILDKGLQPISDFILEKNFRQRIQQTHLGKMSSGEQCIPYISIVRPAWFAPDSLPTTYLRTRHHDMIRLGIPPTVYKEGDPRQQISELSRAIAEQKSGFYGLEINSGTALFFADTNFVDAGNLDEGKMKKFVNTQTGMVYLFEPTLKVAFSFPDDDYTVDVYGIREWVDRMPRAPLSMLVLERDYTVIGL